MNLLESLIYGFVSGFTHFLPISSTAHQRILGAILGADTNDPVRSLIIHIAIFAAVYANTRNIRERYEKARRHHSRNIKNGKIDSLALAEYSLLKNATICFIPVFFIACYIFPAAPNFLLISLSLILNGLVIFLPDRMLKGNKNAKVMSKFDCALIGVIGALSAIPGFSYVGVVVSVALLRGAEHKSAVNWAMSLSVTALACWIFCDIIRLFSVGLVPFWPNFFGYLFSAIFAYAGTRMSIYVLRKHIRKTGCSGYAYYCWSAAVFALILFLIAV